MAFTDVSDNSRVILEASAPVRITLSGTVYSGDLIGYSSGWQRADDDSLYPAILVAGQSGVSGDVTTAYRSARIGGITSGTTGAKLYLSDSGGYATSAGTVSQVVGYDMGGNEMWIEPEAETPYFEDDVTIYGADLKFSGAANTHAINFDNATVSKTLIGCASYSSPADQSATTGFAQFCSTSDDADSWRYGMGIYTKGTGSGTKLFGIGLQQEYNGTDGVDRMQSISAIALLGGGGESARLKTLGGDATAGMYAIWAKVGANTNCTVDSGSRVAPLWIDNQMNCVCSGEEYAMFITCGGSKVDAVMGLETTSSGWTNFLYFDETSYDQDPVVASGCDVSGAGADEAYLRVNLNGTEYGIPLIAI